MRSLRSELEFVDDGLKRLRICEIGNPSGARSASKFRMIAMPSCAYESFLPRAVSVIVADVFHELFVVEKLKQRLELAGLSIDHHQREDAAVRMAITRRPTPRRICALQHVHHAGECRVRRKRKPVAQRLQLSAQLILQIVRHARRACSAA